MTQTPTDRRHLPMAGLTHGNRNPVTCHLRCGDACSFTPPNTTDNDYFRDVATRALSRRRTLGLAGAGAVALGVAATTASPAAARPGRRIAGKPGGKYPHTKPTKPGKPPRSRLLFTPVAPQPADTDSVGVPAGYSWDTIVRWGDPILPGAPAFDASNQTQESAEGQFGYNCDYLDIIETNSKGTRALLVANHEYTNEEIMFPPDADPETVVRVALASHGMSVVELRRAKRGDAWSYVPGAAKNRRITAETPFTFDGPVRGSALLRTAEDPRGVTVRGTLNNCAGGTTPWGTVLSGEENFNQYFLAAGTDVRESRYGLGPTQDTRGWRNVDERFDATSEGYRNEPHRFGWIVEVDPTDPTSTPVKHTAMGRFKHEGANVIVNEDGHVVAYMGDDERFDYVYRFVSRKKIRKGNSPGARRHNLTLLSEGDLSVAKFIGDGLEDGVSDGIGRWLPLTRAGRSMVAGMSLEEVLVFTRLAADKAGATKMDRPEDVEPNLVNGHIYVACTNNTDRGKAGKEGPTEPNPRNANKDGHVVEMIPHKGDHTDERFRWNLLLICGDPGTAGTYFGGYEGPVSPISCPDNVAFDSVGNLWVSTDGQPSSTSRCDALFKVPVTGPQRGRVQQFLSVPAGAETCGPVIRDTDGEGSVFVAVQHPGDGGTWEAPTSFFPDYVSGSPGRGELKGPRPSVIQVRRR